MASWRSSLDEPDGSLVLRAGRLFDGTGGGYREAIDVLIDGGRIVTNAHVVADARQGAPSQAHVDRPDADEPEEAELAERDDAGGGRQLARQVHLLVVRNPGGCVVQVDGDHVLVPEALDLLDGVLGQEPVPAVEDEADPWHPDRLHELGGLGEGVNEGVLAGRPRRLRPHVLEAEPHALVAQDPRRRLQALHHHHTRRVPRQRR